MNNEARIECLVESCYLPDMGLKNPYLKRGQVEWVPTSSARGSVSLQQAVKTGSVEVSYRSRSLETRIPSTEGRKPKVTTTRTEDRVSNSDELSRTIRDAVALAIQGSMGQIRKIVAEEIQAALAAAPQKNTTDFLAQVLEQVKAGKVVLSPDGHPVWVAEEKPKRTRKTSEKVPETV